MRLNFGFYEKLMTHLVFTLFLKLIKRFLHFKFTFTNIFYYLILIKITLLMSNLLGNTMFYTFIIYILAYIYIKIKLFYMYV